MTCVCVTEDVDLCVVDDVCDLCVMDGDDCEGG